MGQSRLLATPEGRRSWSREGPRRFSILRSKRARFNYPIVSLALSRVYHAKGAAFLPQPTSTSSGNVRLPEGRLAGRFGALIVETGDGKRFKVGTGLADSESAHASGKCDEGPLHPCSQRSEVRVVQVRRQKADRKSPSVAHGRWR